jgi:Uma2 family endonuclease
VRAPDLAFVCRERLPPENQPRGFWEIAPDLVVEVVSPNDTRAEIQLKVREWIEAGVRLVWVVYPDSRTVEVIRTLLDREELTADDTLDGGDVLPGFSCAVAELFA